MRPRSIRTSRMRIGKVSGAAAAGCVDGAVLATLPDFASAFFCFAAAF